MLTGAAIAILALVTASQPTGAQQGLVLEGRIEEIVRGGSGLPAKVVLRKMTPKADPRLPLRGSALDSCYPEFLLGRWGGELRNTWARYAPEFAADTAEQYRVGNSGWVVFHFNRPASTVVLEPTVIYFRRTRSVMTPARELSSYIEGNYENVRAQVAQTGTYVHVPILRLAEGVGKSYAGTSMRTRPAFNTLKTLKRGVVEQDVVMEQTDVNTGAVSYQETVTRFVWYGPGKVYTQVVVAYYDSGGTALRKTMLEGWITPNWKIAADQISAQMGLPWEQIVKNDGLQ